MEFDEELSPDSVSSNYARSRFAELLRRVEYGKERVRLTRRGKPIAYIVPLEDGERLHQTSQALKATPIALSDKSHTLPENVPSPPEEGQDASYADAAVADIADMPTETEPHHGLIMEHNDDDQRNAAIEGFKKGLNRIFASSELLTRSEMAQRLRKDGYLSSSLRRILGEG